MENINESLGIKENKSNEPRKSSGFSDYFSFRKIISMTFIKIIYVIGIIAIILLGIAFIYEGIYYIGDDQIDRGYENIWISIGILTLGNIVWRIICEGWILLFQFAISVSNIGKNYNK